MVDMVGIWYTFGREYSYWESHCSCSQYRGINLGLTIWWKAKLRFLTDWLICNRYSQWQPTWANNYCMWLFLSWLHNQGIPLVNSYYVMVTYGFPWVTDPIIWLTSVTFVLKIISSLATTDKLSCFVNTALWWLVDTTGTWFLLATIYTFGVD